MSCVNPGLIEVLDTHRFLLGQVERYKELGWKFSKDNSKAYYFLADRSRHIPLESSDVWLRQDAIEIPCGSCLACRIDYAADWAVRCQFEAKLWKNNYFVTLTYNDENLPFNEKGNPTLVKEHVDKFIKAVRHYFEHRGHKGIRYLLCGEYNTEGSRMLNPHYHMILFNCPIPDLSIDFPCDSGGVVHKTNSMGLPMFHSKIIASMWSKGYIAIDDANYNTEAYVSRYIMKKQKGESSKVYDEVYGSIPPFLRMSNRPGIGFNMFMKDIDRFALDPMVILSGCKKPIVSSLPKYFKRKLFEHEPSLRDDFTERAQEVERNMRSIRAFYGTTSNQQKQYKESHLESVQKTFQRNNT